MAKTHPAIAAYHEAVAREREGCDALFKARGAARDLAYDATPAAVRPAGPADIVAGTVLWRRRDDPDRAGDVWDWVRVQRVTDPVRGGFLIDGEVSSGVMPGDAYHDPSGWQVEDVAQPGPSGADGPPDGAGRDRALVPSASRPLPPLHVIAYHGRGDRWQGMVEAGSPPTGWPGGVLHSRISAPFGPDVDVTLDDVAAADAHETCMAYVSHLAEGAPVSGASMADAYFGFAAKRDWFAAREIGLRLVDTLANTSKVSGIAAAVAAAHFVVSDPNVAVLGGRVMEALRDLPQDEPDVVCMAAFVAMALGPEHGEPREHTLDLMRVAVAAAAMIRPALAGTVRLLNARFGVIRPILEAERPDATLLGDLDAVSTLLRSAALDDVRATYADRA